MPKDTRDVADVMSPPADAATGKTAVLYRMALPNHLCPSGQKARWLLERQGYQVDDRLFRTRAEVDAFKAEHDVKTTPQAWIDGERVGGYTDLREKLTGWDPKATTYRPVIFLFAVAALTAVALSIGFLGAITYLLARRWVPYAYVYPFVETGAGILMTGMVLTWVSAPAALFIAGIGAVSVFKAVYIDKRDLKCACVGGNSNVPLGFVSLIENVMMVGMALVMLWLMV